MSGERAAEVSRPTKCPECGGKKVDDLASSETTLRYQCGNPSCLHQWSTQRDGLKAALARAREERRPESQEEANVAKLKCGKCGKDYTHPKRLETHEASCSGESAGKEKPARKRLSSKVPRQAVDLAIKGDVVGAIVVDLKAKREALISGIPELAQIDKAIAALEGVQGGGGDPQNPSPARPRRKDHDGSVEEDPDLP